MPRRRYALVTGASSGIGASFARLAAREGFDVGLVARRRPQLEALAVELCALGAHADVFVSDLSRPGAAASLAAEVLAKQRPVDMLINNAGATLPKGFAGTTMEEQRGFIELTIATPTALAHAFLPGMLAQEWGRIINVSSLAALSSGGKGNTLYPAGKSFLLKFSQSLNAEVKGRGVRVTAVLPGIVATEFQAANGIPIDQKSGSGRMAQTPDEVAHEAWVRNQEGHEIVVPSMLPKLVAALMRFLPEPMMRTLTRAAAEKYYVGE
jgi:uncharacterized protein